MKKIIGYGVGLIILVGAISVYRANTYFEDVQFKPTAQTNRIAIDTDASVARFSKALQIATISKDHPAPVDPEPFLAFHNFLETSYPNVTQNSERTIINGYSLVYKFQGSDPSLKPILLMGHMDVVPVDGITLDKWTHPPFAGAVADGTIWGRGTMDDKVTVVALMEAMELTLAKGNPLKRTMYFAFGHDEEVGGSTGAKEVAQYFKDQGMQFEFVLDEGGAIIEDMMPGIEGKVGIIGIAEKGFVNIRLEVDQEGGHSSSPPENTGPGILAQAIVKIENNKFDANLEFTNKTFKSLGYYADFNTRFAMANQWLLGGIIKSQMLKSGKAASSIRTTTAVTMLSGSSKSNILPTKSTATVNFRIMPGETWETVRDHVEKTIDDPRVKLVVFMNNNPSAVSSTDSYGFKLMEETIREFHNDTLVAPYMVPGGTDSKYFYEMSDSIYRFMMVSIKPEMMGAIHGIDEHVTIENYETAIQFFYELIRKSAVNPAS